MGKRVFIEEDKDAQLA